MFFDLRRDINNIFDIPFVGYVDPFEELLDMRRRMIDVFDWYVPQRRETKRREVIAKEAWSEGENENENEKEKEKEKEKETEKEKEKDKRKEKETEDNKNEKEYGNVEKEKEGVIVKEKGSDKNKRGIGRRYGGGVDGFGGFGGFGGVRQWVPRCDVHEDEREYVVHAEVPGMKKEDIRVEFNPETHVMVLSGERKDEREEKKDTEKGGYHCVERSYGSFVRSFRVPEECWTKLDDINAKCADGVLEIHCPKDETKREEKKVRSIEIE
jgi:HSP20 family protein